MRRYGGTGTVRSLMDLTFVFCSEEKEFSRTDFLTFYKNLRSLPSGLDSLPKKKELNKRLGSSSNQFLY
jgi:hypothetical protein